MATLKNTTLAGTGAIQLPSGTTAQRPSGTTGSIRYNTEHKSVEHYDGSSWKVMIPNIVTTDLTINYDFGRPYCLPFYNHNNNYLDVDKIGGSSVFDLSGYGNNGHLYRMKPTSGGCIESDGSTGGGGIYFNVDLRQNWSAEFWVNSDVTSPVPFLGCGPTAANQGLHLFQNTASTIRFGFYSNDYDFSNTVSANTWEHYVFTYNHSTSARLAYKNGVSLGSGTYSGSSTGGYAGTGFARFGNTYGPTYTAGASLDGRFGACRLYTKILTATEIAQNYNNTRTRFGV